MSNRFHVLGLAGAACSFTLLTPPALGQAGPGESAGGNTLEEIIVTAQKRETSLQTTPLAISAVTGESLARSQVTNIEGLAQSLPSVNFGQTTGNARIAIRGVGFDNLSLGNEGRVAYHADGVYISRPAAALAGFYDVDRVEVVRGPQGVLYGRNATGGAVNVISRQPGDQLNGYVDGTIGSYDLFRLEGAVGGPIGNEVSGRVSFQVNERNGYGRNLTNGLDVDDLSTGAIRGQLRFQPSENIDLTLAADYFTQDDHAYSFHFIGQGSLAYPATPTTPALPGAIPKGLRVGGVVPTDLRDSTSDSGPHNEREFSGGSATGRFQLGALELVSITGYRSNYFHTVTDLDATSAPLSVYDQIEDSDHFSQEFRLAGDYSQGDWMVGAYYFDESLFGGTRVAFDPLVLVPNTAPILPAPTSLKQGYYGMGDQETEAWAIFANVHHKFTEQFGVRAGVRYSDEKKSVDEVLKLDFATPYPPFVPFFPSTPPGACVFQRS